MNSKLRAWLLFLIFLNGYVSLSLELIVIRQLSFYVGSSAVISGIIIGIFLGFMSLGYFYGGSNKIRKSHVRNILSNSFLTIALMYVLAGSFTLVTVYFTLMYGYGIQSIITQTFIYSALFLSVAPFLFGFNTALMSKYLNRNNGNYTGKIMAWGTIGSVLGSLASTLLLMPLIGVNYTIMLGALLSASAAIMVKPKLKVIIISAAILIPTYIINCNTFLLKQHKMLVNSEISTILITDDGERKWMVMDGITMSIFNKKDRTSAEYMNYINDNFIYSMPRDKKRNILILGAGGFTAGLNDNFHNYTFVDIEKALKDVTEKQFLMEPLTPNKTFVAQDAMPFLKNAIQKYDLILLDVYSNSYQIPEGFITVEFMERIKSRVADGGIILMNVIGSTNFSDDYSRVFDNTFHSVFKSNTQRQVIGYANPWEKNSEANIIYIYYDRPSPQRVYTINKTPVIYDVK